MKKLFVLSTTYDWVNEDTYLRFRQPDFDPAKQNTAACSAVFMTRPRC